MGRNTLQVTIQHQKLMVALSLLKEAGMVAGLMMVMGGKLRRL
jgi:hypothetical protein